MGNSCVSKKSNHARRFSRIESATNPWISYGFLNLGSLIAECAGVRMSMYLNLQNSYIQNWGEIKSDLDSDTELLKKKLEIKETVRK